MRNIIRIGAGTDGRNRFVAIALGVALAVGPAAMLPAAALAAPGTDAAAASTTAGTTITLQGADGASLAGHTFDVYRIGTYTDQILNGTRISSLGVRGDTASNAWAADAIGIANAYDPSTADDIGKVYGYDDADEFQIGYPLGHGPVRQTYDDLLSPAIELGQLADAGAVHRFQVFAQFGDPVACESAHAQPLPIH